MTFKSLLKEKESKTYNYVLKLAVPEIKDEHVGSLIESLQKYELVSAEKFFTTPPQATPFDFPNVKNMPVHRAEIKLKYPASTDFLQNYISQTLGLPLTVVVVQNSGDPRLADVDNYLERSMPEFKAKYVPLIGSEDPAMQHPGLQHNADVAVTNAKEGDTRKIQSVTNSLIPDQQVDHTGLPAGYNNKPTEDGTTLFGRTVPARMKR